MFRRYFFATWLVCYAFAGAPSSRLIDYSDLTPKLQDILSQEPFPALVAAITDSTTRRLREGESEHLIYYLLQSTRFTSQPPIEPALSAREFVGGKIPAAVKKRMLDFLRALDTGPADQRLSWFRKSLTEGERTLPHLASAYAKAMRFLYQKEFAGKTDSGFLYTQRGHSSDTRIESSYAVWTALSILQKLDPSLRLNRVLIVGPGLDFAPRTGFIDSYPPQSYQPWAIADALLQLGLADRSRLQIHCVDINVRVLDFFREFRTRSAPRLTLLASWEDPEYAAYFRDLGRGIGEQRPLGMADTGKLLLLSKDALGFVTAGKLNVVTERYDPSPQYDLAIATNVFVYFDNRELLLALSNIHSMLAHGGYLVHNELRPDMETYTGALDFAPIRAGTIRLSARTGRPLYDGYVIHRKAFSKNSQGLR